MLSTHSQLQTWGCVSFLYPRCFSSFSVSAHNSYEPHGRTHPHVEVSFLQQQHQIKLIQPFPIQLKPLENRSQKGGYNHQVEPHCGSTYRYIKKPCLSLLLQTGGRFFALLKSNFFLFDVTFSTSGSDMYSHMQYAQPNPISCFA